MTIEMQSRESIDEGYWVRQFSSMPSDLDLPADRLRQPVRIYSAGRCQRSLDAQLVEKLALAGERHGCSLRVVFMAGLQALLSRLSRESNIVISAWEQGRWTPVKAAIADGMSFSQLLRQQTEQLREVSEHAEFPYQRLAKGRSSLGGVCFSWNAEVAATAADCDLTLRAMETLSGLTLEWEFNTSIYDYSTISRWLEHYEILLASAADDTNATLQSLQLQSEAQRQTMLVAWNSTEAEYPRDRCVYELIAEQAARTPDTVAAQFDNLTVTYRELEESANQLARYLVRTGVKPGTVVGIYLERSLDMLVGLLGILKAGAGYLPIDPGYPKDRITFILADAKVEVLLTEEALLPTVSGISSRIVCIDSDKEGIAAELREGLSIHAGPQDVAYMIYTSGSTGNPKGVEVPHQALVNLLVSMAKIPGIESDDVLLAVTTLCFDIAAMEIFLPLIVGARLVIARREAAGDPMLLKRRLESCGATIMQATPVTWRILLEAGWDGRPLKKILCGGEAMPRELAEQLLRLGPALWNMYGPTETTIWSSTGRVKSGSGRVPIGPPIANTQLYILDSVQQPVPIGVAGELCIGGDGVARGYHNRTELTAERFVSNPFRNGERMYRTGDLARYLADGTIDFLGRLDHQVKLRGYRIELGEIESVLVKHAAIKQAVVTVREIAPGNQRLVAYLVPSNGRVPPDVEIREFAESQLPDYMVPGVYVALSTLPLTANGKIDRKALPQFESETHAHPKVLPQDDLEEKIAAAWKKTLGLSQVGVEDGFFDIGGDSLQLLTVKAELEKNLATDLTVVDLFQYPTIRSLASHLKQGAGKGAMAAAQQSGRKQSQSWTQFKQARQRQR